MAFLRTILPVAFLMGLVLLPLWLWRLWHMLRSSRRRRLLYALAPGLGFSCISDLGAAGVTEADVTDVTLHIGGSRGGYRADIYERLDRVRNEGVSTETQTVVELSALGRPLPEFLITPQDSHTRYLYHVTRTPHILIAGREASVTHNFVMGQDEEGIRRILTRPVQDLLNNNTTLCIESSGRTLRFYHFDVLLGGPEIVSLVEFGCTFTDTILAAASHLQIRNPRP